jgi:calmodulin
MSNFKLTQKELQEYQEAFSFYDTDRDGFVTVKEIGQIMRSVGLYPSEAELEELKKGGRNKFDFNEFINIASRNMTDNKVNSTQMREAFRIFDQYGTGMVNLLQMRSALQNLGEKLRDEGILQIIY